VRRACLVDENRVDLVDDRVVESALGALREVAGHVVAQVVERELGVGGIGDVREIGLRLGHRSQVLKPFVAVGLVKEVGVVEVCGRGTDVDSDAQPEQVVDRRHPARVSPGQVVVDGDEVDALARKRVQIQGEARDQRLAFTGLHLGDPALVQDDPTHQLDVEVTQANRAAARLAAEGESLDQQVVEVLPFLRPLAQLVRALAEAGVVELLELGLEAGDGGRDREMALDLALVGVKKLGKAGHLI